MRAQIRAQRKKGVEKLLSLREEENKEEKNKNERKKKKERIV